MTDETREQIKTDAAKWFGDDFKRGNRSAIDIFKDGATHQHPIAFAQGLAEGRRQAIDDCIVRMKELFKIIANGEQEFVLKELEKLKQ